jgi:hypothetical protein
VEEDVALLTLSYISATLGLPVNSVKGKLQAFQDNSGKPKNFSQGGGGSLPRIAMVANRWIGLF